MIRGRFAIVSTLFTTVGLGDASVAYSPSWYGPRMRGSAGLPWMTSSSPVSSPNR